MSNPFLLSPGDRLFHWREFRKSLTGLPLVQQITHIATYWGHTPIGPIAYDPDNAEGWLTPWELIYNNQWCRSSVAIGIDATLRLAGVDPDRLRLHLITDKIHGSLLVLIVDDQFVLNYDWGSVQTIPLPDHKIMRRWRFAERGYIQI